MRILFLVCVFFIAALSAAHAATVNVVPSSNVINQYSSFSVLVSATGFPETGGATLDLRFNPRVVQVSRILLAAGSPFDVISATPINNVTGEVASISILAPLTGVLPSGSFDVFRVEFHGILWGAANISLVEDGVEKGWVGVDGSLISGITYNQADVTVTPYIVPLPAAAWLLLSGLGVLLSNGRFARGAFAWTRRTAMRAG